jgi:2-keto-4-pentenoate hydratase
MVSMLPSFAVPRFPIGKGTMLRQCRFALSSSAGEGSGSMVLGHPLNALLWLAQTLHQRGQKLRTGDMIVTGACCGITKVAAGQTFAGCFADFPPLEIQFV